MITETNERWKPISGYEDNYEINTLGKIRCKYTLKCIRVGKFNLVEKFLSTRINNWGYEEVRLFKEGKTSTKFIHKLLGQAFIPNEDNKLFINHKNGIKTDNQLANLEWVTHSENMIHAYRTGLLKKVSKPVIDNCSNAEYKSAREASTLYRINYFTLKNYLNGSRPNPTCLQYKQAA